VYSPYLAAFDNLEPGASLEARILDKSCGGSYSCLATAKVMGRETISVPAGTFETIKIAVHHSWRPNFMGVYGRDYVGERNLTVWYAPAAKRAVKFSSRLDHGDRPPMDAPNFDLELVSFKLQ
jgi:hypothetical protein